MVNAFQKKEKRPKKKKEIPLKILCADNILEHAVKYGGLDTSAIVLSTRGNFMLNVYKVANSAKIWPQFFKINFCFLL